MPIFLLFSELTSKLLLLPEGRAWSSQYLKTSSKKTCQGQYDKQAIVTREFGSPSPQLKIIPYNTLDFAYCKALQTLILCRPLQDPASAVAPTWQPRSFQGKSQGELPTPCKSGSVGCRIKPQGSLSWKCRSTSPSSLYSISPPNSCLLTTPETGRRLSNFHNFHSETLQSFLFPSWTLL